jgi:hypothetical protein
MGVNTRLFKIKWIVKNMHNNMSILCTIKFNIFAQLNLESILELSK